MTDIAKPLIWCLLFFLLLLATRSLTEIYRDWGVIEVSVPLLLLLIAREIQSLLLILSHCLYLMSI